MILVFVPNQHLSSAWPWSGSTSMKINPKHRAYPHHVYMISMDKHIRAFYFEILLSEKSCYNFCSYNVCDKNRVAVSAKEGGGGLHVIKNPAFSSGFPSCASYHCGLFTDQKKGKSRKADVRDHLTPGLLTHCTKSHNGSVMVDMPSILEYSSATLKRRPACTNTSQKKTWTRWSACSDYTKCCILKQWLPDRSSLLPKHQGGTLGICY